eukprot:TRINITY_DN14740_c0_g1_i1.p1 TRINITY_DN14740_c0_g1~~TRINITY_DN14740_c0_g1_i1.p1  ORF type:complete len:331 (-),score=-34.72 TRINITY_DN14740_c0_g1_i1:306-1298(-)
MDLRTKYLGMNLETPLIVSASPFSKDVASLKRIEDAGASAVTLHSLFEERIRMEQKELFYQTNAYNELSPEANSFYPEMSEYRTGPEEYLELISKAKSSLKIPVIASLNGASLGGWTSYAKLIEEAGADALELNIYFIPNDLNAGADRIEELYIDILKAVKSSVSIPVALKLSPFFSNLAYMAKRFEEAGANSLVLFNRFYQPDINLNELVLEPKIDLSSSVDNRLPLRWIAILRDRVNLDFAATSGVHTGLDSAKLILAGANVTAMCSSLLKNGLGHIKTVRTQLEDWMSAKEYDSVEQMRGSFSQIKLGSPDVFERALYIKAISSYNF